MKSKNKKINIENFLPSVKKNVLLKNYSTFKIGGKAKYFFVAKTKKDLIKAILLAKKNNLPFFILGNGSNTLISDKGYNGLIIKIQNSKIKIKNSKILTEAGVMFSELVTNAAKIGLTGLEWAAGIPGTIGGGVVGNAGAFDKSVGNLVKEVEVFDIKKEKIKILKNKDCIFSYRESIFKKNKNFVILSILLKLKKGNKRKIKNKTKKYLNLRIKKQPLKFFSIGSIFKNHKGEIKNKAILKKYPELILFNKKREIPTGWLIEKCNLKGKKIGGAKISEKHANFILNFKKAKFQDVKKLIKLIKQKVKDEFKIKLKEEICYLNSEN